ncbi:tetraacyldisaccharide 4'-kinase [Methylocystis sp. L43]|jgi:tetraacyldisaccharide 4'-kinase|uniref:tetraacyldisaccharide 4'-kinase n=1 Tax=unclassified Methylocystis TaxID=2625913 RepID=UPI0018C31236|nr:MULTISPECIES: tetraacyldisaccharide 4'-kinase [unclassified Methylocystis]MBG0796751.1 tetraacyldisaccharide 4'-kinase [Methylocystis sp. L43]MBG0806750.1 tetraacyldisaccharide 4'-kinase [Methylocystis sp. H15]
MRAPAFWREDGATARLLSPLGALYGDIARKRLAREAPRANLPTIVIGGLTAGGDGKTPLAIAVAQRLKAAGERPALLTRGYRRRRRETSSFVVDVTRHGADDVGDEALLLARVAPTIVGSDRLASAGLARRQGATVVILDDGFHSRRVTPDLTLIVIDSDYGAGNGRCLPAGPLRAPLDAQLAAADMLVVVGDGLPGRDIAACANKPVIAAHLAPDSGATEAMNGARLVAFAGIARPEKFFSLLEASGAEVAARVSFGDHRRFTQRDYATLSKLRQEQGARLVTTEKDAARMGDQLAALGADAWPVTLVFHDAAFLDEALRQLRKARRSEP